MTKPNAHLYPNHPSLAKTQQEASSATQKPEVKVEADKPAKTETPKLPQRQTGYWIT